MLGALIEAFKDAFVWAGRLLTQWIRDSPSVAQVLHHRIHVPEVQLRYRVHSRSNRAESIHFLGVLRRELCLLTTAEFGIPSLKSGAEFVIEDMHSHLQQ